MEKQGAMEIIQSLQDISLKQDYERVAGTYDALCKTAEGQEGEIKQRLDEHNQALGHLNQAIERLGQKENEGIARLLKAVNREANRQSLLEQLQDVKDKKIIQIALDNKALEMENDFLKKELEEKKSDKKMTYYLCTTLGVFIVVFGALLWGLHMGLNTYESVHAHADIKQHEITEISTPKEKK